MEDFLGQATYQRISRYVDEALSGKTVHYQGEIPYIDVRTRFVDATYIPDLDATGIARGYFALVQDITERRQAEEEVRKWADAFEHCAHGIALGDPTTNRVVVCNSAFAALHRSRIEDIVGSSILSLYAPSYHPRVRQSITRADQVGHAQFEANMIRRDGSTFPVQMDLVSVRGDDGDLLYRVATAQDIRENNVGGFLPYAHELEHSPVTWTATLSRSGRTADATERFMAANGMTPNDRWVGNPTLDPEQHHQFELGAQAESAGWDLNGAVYVYAITANVSTAGADHRAQPLHRSNRPPLY